MIRRTGRAEALPGAGRPARDHARRWRHGGLACILSAGALLVGCARGGPAPATSFLRSVDLVDMTDRMGESLSASPAVAARAATDAPWIVSLSRLSNFTNQIIAEGEKWLYLVRLRSQLAQTDLSQERAIAWIIPADKWRLVHQEPGLPPEPYGVRADPTHVLTAEFHALTHTGAAGRSDAYLCAYHLLDLSDGRLVWEDAWEVKRTIHGRTWD